MMSRKRIKNCPHNDEKRVENRSGDDGRRIENRRRELVGAAPGSYSHILTLALIADAYNRRLRSLLHLDGAWV